MNFELINFYFFLRKKNKKKKKKKFFINYFINLQNFFYYKLIKKQGDLANNFYMIGEGSVTIKKGSKTGNYNYYI